MNKELNLANSTFRGKQTTHTKLIPRMCYGRHHEFVNHYGNCVSQLLTDIFPLWSPPFDPIYKGGLYDE